MRPSSTGVAAPGPGRSRTHAVYHTPPKSRAFPPRVVETITYLPEAGRGDQMSRWGLSPEFVGDRGRPDVHEFSGGVGFGVVSTSGGQDHGMVAHRGVLHPDEYVDETLVRGAVCELLGYPFDLVTSVYRQGPKSPMQLEVRDHMDSRFLGLADGGGNMIELARVLGWTAQPATHGGGETCRTMDRVLARARAVRDGS